MKMRRIIKAIASCAILVGCALNSNHAAVAAAPRAAPASQEMQEITLQYRNWLDAIAASQFVALIGDGMTLGLRIDWKIGEEAKRWLDARVAQLEEGGPSGQMFVVKGIWIVPGRQLEVYEIRERPDQIPADELLQSLLWGDQASEVRRRILMDLTHRWAPEAEEPLAMLMMSPDEDLSIRTTAAEALILHGQADYHNLLVEYAQQGSFKERMRWFDLLSAPSHEKRTGIDPRVVQIGFDLILEYQEIHPDYVHGAYFLAVKTGTYIGRVFTPDSRKPEYQGEHGLTESFFADTVVNAMEWWANNRTEVEKALPTR